jgi:hypothetical protein
MSVRLAFGDRERLTLFEWPTRVSSIDGKLYYAAGEPFRWYKKDLNQIDPQIRLFRPSLVKWNTAIHTPGFCADAVLYASTDAYIFHLDWILHSPTQRTEKIAAYDRQCPGAGTWNSHFYLPEMTGFSADTTLIVGGSVAAIRCWLKQTNCWDLTGHIGVLEPS